MASKGAVRRVRADLEEANERSCWVEDVQAARGSPRDVEVPVAVNREAVEHGVALVHRGERLHLPAAPALHGPGVTLHPYDASVGLDDDAVRVGRRTVLEHLATAVGSDGEDPARIRSRDRVVAPWIGEVQTTVRPEREVVRGLEGKAFDLGDEDLDLTGVVDSLNRGRARLLRTPRADHTAVLGHVQLASRAERRGVRPATGKGEPFDPHPGGVDGEVAAVGLDENDPAVVEDGGTLGPGQVGHEYRGAQRSSWSRRRGRRHTFQLR